MPHTMPTDADVYEILRLELRRGSLILAVLGVLRAEHYGYSLRKALAGQGVDAGAELVGEVERYGDSYRLCYVRGPEGIIVELAERIG